MSRVAVGAIWIYHGLIPKILFRHSTELELVSKGPLIVDAETTVLLAGIAEVIVGSIVLIFWRQVWPVWVSLIGFSMLLIGAIIMSPEKAVYAFNPITLTGSAIFFCLIQFCETKRAEMTTPKAGAHDDE